MDPLPWRRQRGGRVAATKEQYVGEDKRQLAPSAVDNEKLKERGKIRASLEQRLRAPKWLLQGQGQ